MSKTPYEIRLDILKMAQDMLDRETRIEETKFGYAVRAIADDNVGNPSAVQSYIETNAPKMYTPEDIISKSQALYNFVNDTSSVRKARDK